ncbi:MAG: hypothetical protein KatS3mg119_0118 [Rhodothalassiaceae bacterium]|nr:MAG: hypothetical protein KatS3mg119_0118 [Rhodothalassiaceae bacterium]
MPARWREDVAVACAAAHVTDRRIGRPSPAGGSRGRESAMTEYRQIEPGGAAAQAGFGAVLRAARAARGLDLKAVAARLKIRRVYLEALEEEDLKALPARPFAIGFMRAYAHLLGLEPEPLVARLKEGLLARDGDACAREAPLPPAAEAASGEAAGSRSRAALLLAPLLFVALALLLGFYLPRLDADGQDAARNAARHDEAPAGASAQGVRKASSLAPVEVRPARRAGAPARRGDRPRAADRAPRMSAEAAPAATPAVAFRVAAGAWVLVKDGMGRPLWSGVLPAGELWVPPEGAVALATTHPGNLVVILHGADRGPLGTAMQAVLDVPLKPEALAAFLAERARKARLVQARR